MAEPWTEFFITLGKCFFIVIMFVLVAVVLYITAKWMKHSEKHTAQIKPRVGGIYDSKGRLIERGVGK